MDLDTISNAAALALASTLVALVLVKSMQLIGQPFASSRHFRSSIMIEAAQRFRDELERLRGRQVLFGTLALIFAASFATAVLTDPNVVLGQPATWQKALTFSGVAAAFGYGIYHFLQILVIRRRIAFVRDATIATGHSLQTISSNRNRVFHDVKTPLGTVDNVVVGLHGVYLVDVVARRPGKDNRARLTGAELSFAPNNETIDVTSSANKARQLAKMLGKVVGHPIGVRPVIAVPGWEIESQASDRFLAVNERSVGMLRGWKNESDYLMNEDVDALQDFLANAHGCRKSHR